MKLSLVILSLTFTTSLFAQKMIGDSIYISKDSLRFEAGQYIDAGKGTMTKDSFKYIYLSPMNVVYLVYGETRRIYLDSSAGKKLLIKKVKQTGTRKNGFIYLLVVTTTKGVAYYCNIEQALATGEIKKKNSY